VELVIGGEWFVLFDLTFATIGLARAFMSASERFCGGGDDGASSFGFAATSPCGASGFGALPHGARSAMVLLQLFPMCSSSPAPPPGASRRPESAGYLLAVVRRGLG
jgi:hypothetical protein